MADRDLSPYSARLALTKKLQQEQGNQAAPVERTSRPWDSQGPPERQNGGRVWPPQKETGRLSPPRKRSPPPRRTRDRSPEEWPRQGKSTVLSVEAVPAAGHREASPEPYRQPREVSRERKRDRSKGRDRGRERPRSRDRDRSRDRYTTKERDRSRDRHSTRERNRSRDRHSTKERAHSRDRHGTRDRDRSRDRHRERRRERSGERRRERSRERRRSKDPDRKRDRSKDRYRSRSRSRDRHRHKRDRSKDRRSCSPLPHRSLKRRSPSSSPTPKRPKHTRSRSPSAHPRSSKALPSQEISFRGLDSSTQPPTAYGGAPKTLEKPNFKPTGALAKAANKVEGTKISLKYHEPPEARKPPASAPWRIFVFKGDDVIDTIELHTRSCWLLGRSAEVVDYVLEHPSSSGQHAAIQFRYIQKTVEDEFGVKKVRGNVKPYVIDLESSNGTELNGEMVETSRYLELRDKDILKFAGSEREYVVMLPPAEG